MQPSLMTSDTSPRLSVVATSDVSRHQTADQSPSASQVNVCESESVWHFIDGDKKGTLNRHSNISSIIFGSERSLRSADVVSLSVCPHYAL